MTRTAAPVPPSHAGQCDCGHARFTVRGQPLMRGLCHCTICQAFSQAPHADISIYRAADVDMPDPETIEFRTHRPPPAVQRGQCRECGKPAVEVMQIFPFPKLIFVPTGSLPADCHISPAMHVFYHSRIADSDDALPHYSGYWKSQWAFMLALLKALLRGRSAAPG